MNDFRTELYPAIEPYETGWLAPDETHRLYWEQSGNPGGVPVLFLHGGPGGGCAPHHRRYFDPSHYRAVLFDQRGAGRSRPLAELRANTTEHLVADIEILRKRLGIGQWLVFGGSWGATLALAYGEAHPQRCLGFVLRGVFLARPAEIDWWVNRMRTFFPDHWERFAHAVPPEERGDLVRAYGQRFASADALRFARIWAGYEAACARLLPEAEDKNRNPDDDDAFSLAIATIEAHYMANGCFLDANQLLDGIGRIAHLPCIIVQGRYDVVCPPATAWDLHRAWPGSDLRIVPGAGHSANEDGIRAGLVAACERFKQGAWPVPSGGS